MRERIQQLEEALALSEARRTQVEGAWNDYRRSVITVLQDVYNEMQDGAIFTNVTLAIAARIALANLDATSKSEA